jgi:hypothetical protein
MNVGESGEIRRCEVFGLVGTVGPAGSGSRQGVRPFAMVVRMPDNSVDPSGNTEAFRAFTQNAPEEPATASRAPLIIGAVIVAIVVIALIVWLVA